MDVLNWVRKGRGCHQKADGNGGLSYVMEMLRFSWCEKSLEVFLSRKRLVRTRYDRFSDRFGGRSCGARRRSNAGGCRGGKSRLVDARLHRFANTNFHRAAVGDRFYYQSTSNSSWSIPVRRRKSVSIGFKLHVFVVCPKSRPTDYIGGAGLTDVADAVFVVVASHVVNTRR